MRNLFELLYYLREFLLLLLAILVSLGLLLTGETRQSIALQTMVTNVVGLIPSSPISLADIVSYKEENDVLRQRLMRYALLNAELADVARENERLRSMLRFTRESPYQLQVAEVTSRGASGSLTTITLNIGTDHGVAPNQPVLVTEGLLGKTITVGKAASVVQLIADRNFRLSVKVGPEGIRGIMKPMYGTRGEIVGIPPTASVRPGDRVLTSGFSDIYPKNLPVAVVEDVSTRPGESFSRVQVRYHADPALAEYVFVMTGDGTGS